MKLIKIKQTKAGFGDAVPDDDEPKPIKKLIKVKQIVPPNSDDEEEHVIEKPKAKRTQKQIDAFQKVRDKKMENARLREQERKLLLEQIKF